MKVSDMFPRRYATGDDLKGKPVTLTIAAVRFEEMRPGGGPATQKPVVYFENAKKGVVLCRQLAEQIAAAVGEDDTDHWQGQRITLYPLPMTVAGRRVTAIRARAANGKEAR